MIGVDEDKILQQVSDLLEIGCSKLRLVHQKSYIILEDATKKAIVYSGKKPVAFVLISSESHPHTLLNCLQKSTEISRAMGAENARHVLIPDIVDTSNNLSYSITRYYSHLKSNFLLRFIHKRFLGILIVFWLTNVLKITGKIPAPEDVKSRYIEPLKSFFHEPALNDEHRILIRAGLKSIENGEWVPRTTCAHNDLWSGNVLVNSFFDFLIIDWGGASVNGYPFYDFIRVSHSFQLPKQIINLLLRRYCRVIGCHSVEQVKYYLIATFAYQNQNLGHWSHLRCIETLNECIHFLDELTQ